MEERVRCRANKEPMKDKPDGRTVSSKVLVFHEEWAKVAQFLRYECPTVLSGARLQPWSIRELHLPYEC